jgi:hypothetical protein
MCIIVVLLTVTSLALHVTIQFDGTRGVASAPLAAARCSRNAVSPEEIP